MAEDVAELWALANGTRCVLSRLDNGRWQVRVERHGAILYQQESVDGNEALDVVERNRSTWKSTWMIRGSIPSR